MGDPNKQQNSEQNPTEATIEGALDSRAFDHLRQGFLNERFDHYDQRFQGIVQGVRVLEDAVSYVHEERNRQSIPSSPKPFKAYPGMESFQPTTYTEAITGVRVAMEGDLTRARTEADALQRPTGEQAQASTMQARIARITYNGRYDKAYALDLQRAGLEVGLRVLGLHTSENGIIEPSETAMSAHDIIENSQKLPDYKTYRDYPEARPPLPEQ